MKSNYFYQVVSFKEKLIFLTPPKCSTYSLNKFLVDSNVSLNNPINHPQHPFYHPTLKEIIQAYNISNIKEYKIIQIVRNPYDRFISSYVHEQKLLKKSLNLDNYISQIEQYKSLLPNNIDKFYKDFYQTLEYKNFYYKENSHINNLKYDPIYLSKTQKEKIYNLFKKDFKMFNYEKF